MTNTVNTGNVYRPTSDWFIGTAKRHPEALLVLAAGCALLMRGGGGSSQGAPTRRSNASAASDQGWQVSRATEEVVSDLKDCVTDAASSVSDYAGGVRRNISAQTSQIAGQAQSSLQTGFGHLLREQPLALAVLGLAAGAAIATLLPATEVEERTLAPTRNAIAGVTGKMGENLIEAASEASRQLTQGIADRAAEAVKEVVHEVAERFSDKVAGKIESSDALPSNMLELQSRGS